MAEDIIAPLHPDIIAIQLWEPVPGKSGHIRVAGTRTRFEVREEIIRRLRARKDSEDPQQSLFDCLDYFSFGATAMQKTRDPWPKTWRWIACYVVTGSSEGHYIHVDVIDSHGARELMYLGKTFSGLQKALEISNALTEMLGA